MSSKELKFPSAAALYPERSWTSRLLVGCRRGDYSASRISTAVEDCNAHVLNLNVTDMGAVFDEDGERSERVIVDLRVTHRSPLAVGRSLERYGYEVLLASGGSQDSDIDPLRTRIDEFLRYIDI